MSNRVVPMANEQGYEWITTSGGSNSHQQDGNEPAKNVWRASFDGGRFLQIVQLFAPIVLAFALHIFLETIPNVRVWLEKTGYEALDVLLTLAISGSLGMAIWTIERCVRKQKEIQRKSLLLHTKEHDVMHYIRDNFCATELALSRQVLGIKTKLDAFYASPHTSIKQMKKTQKALIEDIGATRTNITHEMVRFYSGICNEIASALTVWTHDDKMGCCIRIAQEAKEGNDKTYCTLGWSKKLEKRCQTTDVIGAGDGIAKIISDGIINDTKKCAVLIRSINQSIKLEEWKKTRNDEDFSIRSVMILPINFRRLAVEQSQTEPNLRIDGLLYIIPSAIGNCQNV